MPYLGLVLRLADILDFDRDRTPDTLYRTIHFTNDISLMEWEKHRSVEGWAISPKGVRFTMLCTQPNYHKAALEFMDWIEEELVAAKNISGLFPSEFNKYSFDFLPQVDRTRIKAKNNAYIYHDLEFSLSRDEVVKLFMTDELYQSPSLCVRELLQNALDALRYRKSLIKRDTNMEWPHGKVEIVHTCDEYGHEVLRCTDNGVGMDEHIITHYLTKVGRSYYRSPEYQQERNGFVKANADFDPCSQFGIGFMSCFMLGDHIIIHTRRDYGPNNGLGDPFVVEINGLSGMVILRKGSLDQPIGTMVEVIGRKKPNYIDEFDDNVNLIGVIDAYALACEFPIDARCEIPEIEETLKIAPGISLLKTSIEKAHIDRYVTVEQDFSEINPDLRGKIRASFLTDESNRLVHSNSEAAWIIKDNHPKLIKPLNNPLEDSTYGDRICLDGIFVCGSPGRGNKRTHRIGYSSNNLVLIGGDSFTLDVRGKLKPPLTPARWPPNYHRSARPNARWHLLECLACKANGRLWEKIALKIGHSLDIEIFWTLAIIHRAPIEWMRSDVIWSKLLVPIFGDHDEFDWRAISSLGYLMPKHYSISERGQLFESYALVTEDGADITPLPQLIRYDSRGFKFGDINDKISSVIIGISNATIRNNTPHLVLQEPTKPDRIQAEYDIDGVALIPYIGEISQAFSAQMPIRNANRSHPLVKIAYSSKYSDNITDIQKFSRALVFSSFNPDFYKVVANPKSIPNPRTNRQVRYLGNLYISVDWSQYPTEVSPPYKFWINGCGICELTSDHFRKWAQLKAEK